MNLVEQQKKHTVQDAVRQGQASSVGFLFWMANAGQIIPPWWSKERDAKLRSFWQDSDHFSGAMFNMAAKLASVPFKVEPRDVTVKAHIRAADEFNMLLNEAPQFGQGWTTFWTLFFEDLWCLAGSTRIPLAGDRAGKTKAIAQIVKDKDPGPVFSIGHDGRLVERAINQWHKTPLGDRRWWWISLKNASGHSGKRRGGIFITEDHPVLTSMGWIPAKDVKVGMLVATGDPVPNEVQSQILTGALLGDASIGAIRKRAILRFSHSAKQEEWFSRKVDAFNGFQWTGYNCHKTGYGEIIGINSRASLGLMGWRNAWYPGGKKAVDRECIERYFSPMMLAVWYCDDGSMQRNKTRVGNDTSPAGYFWTNGFAVDDVKWLVSFLNDSGIECTLKLNKRPRTDAIYPVIYITSTGFRELTKRIGAYVPPDMRYKLPDDAPDFCASLWESGAAEPFFDEVIESRQRDYTSGNKVVQTTYHIGVEETRNFIAANIAVHNTQDNGAMAEVIGAGKADGPIQGPPLGLAHLDSYNCQRTSDPEYPVIYTDAAGDGRRYRFHYSRVLFASQYPSASSEMYGVGHCWLTRCINVVQNLKDISVYKQEKLGSRPLRSILWGRGIDTSQIIEAIAMAEEGMDNQGLSRYAKTAVIGAISDAFEMGLLDLVSLPDGYDEKTATDLAMYVIALAGGFPPRWLWPATTTGATKADAMYSHIAGTGSGAAWHLDLMARLLGGSSGGALAMTGKVLPPYLKITFDYQDDEQDRLQAEIRKARADRRKIDLETGVVTVRVAREQALSAGDLTRAQFDALELEDGRLPDGEDVLTLFYSRDDTARKLLSLGVDDPLDLAANDKLAMLDAIKQAEARAQDDAINAGAGKTRTVAQQVISALNQLRVLYEQEGREIEAESQQEETPPVEEAPEEMTEIDAEIDEETNLEETEEEEAKEVGVAAGPFELDPCPAECGALKVKQDDEGPPRGDYEDELYDALERPFDRARRDAARAVKRDEDPDYDELHAALLALLIPLLSRAATFRAEALEEQFQLYLDDGLIPDETLRWARQYAEQRAQQLTTATREAVEQARGIDDPDERGRILDRAFNDERRRRIGITEASIALSLGALLFRRIAGQQGAEVDMIWYTQADERVCPVCAPLHGKKQDVWEQQFPSGPPAHVRCRCGLEAKAKR